MKESTKATWNKILFGLPISLFFGTGILVSTDIIQPSFFKNMPVYYPYFIVALIVGYLSVFLASSYIQITNNKLKAYIMMIVYMIFEGLFSLLAINTYYGDSAIPLIRQISALSLPFVFSLFYFLKIIEHSPKPTQSETVTPQIVIEKLVKVKIDEKILFENYDDLESIKPIL